MTFPKGTLPRLIQVALAEVGTAETGNNETKYAEGPTQKIMASYTGGNNHVTIDYLPMSLFEVSKFMSIVNVTPDLSDPAVSVSLLFIIFLV